MADEFEKRLPLPPMGDAATQALADAMQRQNEILRAKLGHPHVFIMGGSIAVAADVLAIPITHSLVRKTTGGDAEALTLANGKAGQLLTIVLAVDGGGVGTLTPATSTGFNTIVFADVEDTATLLYLDGTLGWTIIRLGPEGAPPATT